MAYRPVSRDQHLAPGGPKRILSLDGGGVRGILSLGILQRLETLLRQRHGDDPDFRLAHYFDLIAGTSTGSIIAATLALGHSVDAVIDLYRRFATTVFTPSPWRRGLLRHRYDKQALERALQQELGTDLRLGDPALQTGLLVVTKRMDSGSTWPISNNPQGPFYGAADGSRQRRANADLPLWSVVRASTAAPTFFAPESVTLGGGSGAGAGEAGTFIDGGVSPHNNPALQAFLYATLAGYGLAWPAGDRNLLLLSVGTGRPAPQRRASPISALAGVTALQSLMDDCSVLVETLLQGLSSSPTARALDRELGDLGQDQIGLEPRCHYLRYDVQLHRTETGSHTPRSEGAADASLLSHLSDRNLAALARMDDPSQLDTLLALGQAVADQRLDGAHLPPVFDLPCWQAAHTITAHATVHSEGAAPRLPASRGGGGPSGLSGGRAGATSWTSHSPLSRSARAAVSHRRRYLKRASETVVAVPLNLETDGFRYRQWGGLQTCKPGDWIVQSHGRVHTVDRDTFARTYRAVGTGTYRKITPVWAEPMASPGSVATREGISHYLEGDYLVSNQEDGSDAYAVPAARFEAMYEPLD